MIHNDENLYHIGVQQLLQQLAPRRDVQLLAKRIFDLDRNMRDLGMGACVVKAQICISIGAIPFPEEANEVHMYKKTASEDAPIIIHIGNNYFMRMAELGGGIQFHRIRQATQTEASFLRLGNGRLVDVHRDIVYIGRAFKYEKMIEMVTNGIVTFTEYLNDFSTRCLGIVSAEEIESSKSPIGRDWSWMAEKRCLRDGYAKLFPVRPAKPIQVNIDPSLAKAMVDDELNTPAPELALFSSQGDFDFEPESPGLDEVIEIIETVDLDHINSDLFG